MYKSSVQTVHLGLYGQTAAKTIRLLFEGLRERVSSGGPAESGRYFTGTVARVRVESTKEVVLVARADYITGTWAKWAGEKKKYSAFANDFDTAYVKSWLAAELVRRALGLKTNDTMQLHPASKTSQTSRAWEVFATAAALRGEDIKAAYGEKAYDKVVGRMSDPVMVEIADAVAEETKRIHVEFDEKRRELRREMSAEIIAVRKAYRLKALEIEKEERRAVTAMKKDMLSC